MHRIFLYLCFSIPLAAITFTVKVGGGGDYTTIQACATAMTSGDICTVFAGTYNEHVTLSAGGVGAYKTLQVNGTDVVNVLDFTVNSHTKIIGFHIQNPSSPASQECVGIVNTSTDIYITGNTMYACGLHAMIAGQNASDSYSHLFIQNNVLSYACGTNAGLVACGGISLHGDYNLVERNDISHVSDALPNNYGSHNVIRLNTLHDSPQSGCDPTNINCHIDFVEFEPASTSQYNLIEGNTQLNTLGHDNHSFLVQGDSCAGQCSNMIIRFNSGAHVGSGGILDDNAGSSVNPGFTYVKAYNNTWVDYTNYPGNESFGGTNAFTHNSTNGSQINELFYYPQALSDYNPYSTDASTASTFTVRNNLAYCTGSPCNIHGKVYGSGAFTDDSGNIVSDPLFINYAGNDFHLTAGSPAVGAGTYLTTVAGSDTGSGTSLVVNDAAYFQDGSGITGVQADWLRIGSSTTVQISSVNYTTNTITLASPVSRSVSDPIYLYKDSSGNTVLTGANPSIGAYQSVTNTTNVHGHWKGKVN